MTVRKQPSAEAIRLRLADLCARSEQCEADIRQKLRRYQLSEEEKDKIVSFLIERRFIDDDRYAKAFARDKIRFAGWGPRKIRAALVMKHIPSATITEALEETDEEEADATLMRVAASKARGLDLSVYADRMKLTRSLAARGFDFTKISEAIRGIVSEETDD